MRNPGTGGALRPKLTRIRSNTFCVWSPFKFTLSCHSNHKVTRSSPQKENINSTRCDNLKKHLTIISHEINRMLNRKSKIATCLYLKLQFSWNIHMSIATLAQIKFSQGRIWVKTNSTSQILERFQISRLKLVFGECCDSLVSYLRPVVLVQVLWHQLRRLKYHLNL